MKRIASISTVAIIICSFIGPALAAPATQLTLVKEVVGGEAVATDWVLTADGTATNDLNGAGWVSGGVAPDTFALSESAGPDGYTAGDWNCVGGGVLDGQSLTLLAGDDVTCTIINTYEPEVVIFDTDFALPSMPVGDGAGTPVCVDEASGLLVAGCDVTITADEIDPTSVQKRVDGVCAQGYFIREINSDGSVVCDPDVDTDTVLSEAQVDSFVANNNYSTGEHTVDTTLTEREVDEFVANNGYSMGMIFSKLHTEDELNLVKSSSTGPNVVGSSTDIGNVQDYKGLVLEWRMDSRPEVFHQWIYLSDYDKSVILGNISPPQDYPRRYTTILSDGFGTMMWLGVSITGTRLYLSTNSVASPAVMLQRIYSFR